MENGANASLGPATSNAGGLTSDPQSGAGGQSSSIAGQPQNLQTANTTSSINNQSTGVPIQLQPSSTELRTAAIAVPSPKSSHKVSAASAVVVTVLIVVVVIVTVYIYLTNKKAVKNTY